MQVSIIEINTSIKLMKFVKTFHYDFEYYNQRNLLCTICTVFNDALSLFSP